MTSSRLQKAPSTLNEAEKEKRRLICHLLGKKKERTEDRIRVGERTEGRRREKWETEVGRGREEREREWSGDYNINV